MPIGQEPTQATTNIIKSTENLKVYFKLKPTDDWEIDKTLICLSHSKTKGLKIGQAQFAILYYNNLSSSAEWKDADQAMRYNAAVKYRVDTSSGYKTPYLVKVTDSYSGTEKPVWYGYIATANTDLVDENADVMGLTYAGLMDQQDIYGGWYLMRDGATVDYLLDYVPVYNPNGIGNKSNKFLTTTSPVLAYGIDRTLEKQTKTDDNLWTAKDMISQIIARCISGLFTNTSNTYNPWKWAGDLYRKIPSPLDVTKVSDILEKSEPVSNYTLQGKSMWQAIVEIVEAVDGLTISEEIDDDGDVYLIIVTLNSTT